MVLRPNFHFRTWLHGAAFLLLASYLRGAELTPLQLPNAPTPTPVAGKVSDTISDFTAAEVEHRRSELQKEIGLARLAMEKLPREDQEETALRLTQELALLERIDVVYVEQQHILQHAADLAKEDTEVEESLRARRPPETTFKPPYGLRLLDDTYGARDYLNQAQAWLKADIANAITTLADAREQFDDKNRIRRSARGAVENAAEKSAGQAALRLAELESRLAEETVRTAEKSLHTLQFQQALLKPKIELLRPRFDWLRTHLNLTDDDSASFRAQAEKRGADLDKAIAAAKDEAEKTSRLVVAAERRGTGEAKGMAELESRRSDRQTTNLSLGILTAERTRALEFQKVMDSRRSVLAGKIQAKDMRDLAELNETSMQELDKLRRRQVTEMLKARQELRDLEGRLARSEAGERTFAWTNDRARRLTAYV